MADNRSIMAILKAYPIEICFDPGQYLARLTLAIAFNKPFFRHPITFKIVATSDATFATVTQRNNVCRHRSGAIGTFYRNPVIHSQYLPQTRWLTANCAVAIEILKRTIPITLNKLAGNVPSFALQTHLRPMFLLVSLPNLLVLLRLITPPSVEICLLAYLAAASASMSAQLFAVKFAQRFERITLRTLLHSLRNFETLIRLVTSINRIAMFAVSVQAARGMAVLAEEFGGIGLPFLTATTSLEGRRQIQHSAPSYADFLNVDGQAGEVPAFPVAIGRPSANIISQVCYA